MATSSPSSADVILFATSWCGFCTKTRKLLDKNKIPYFEYDIETSAIGKKKYNRMRGHAVPLLVINGEIIRGYAPEKILALLK